MNDTTFQGNGKIAYVPVVVNAKPPKPSNADKIRAMSDEKLADWIAEFSDCAACKCVAKHPKCAVSDESCAAAWLDWLRQEAET